MYKRLRDEDAADILYYFYYGTGIRALSNKFDVSESTMYRYLRSKTEEVYSVVSEVFRDSMLGGMRLNFGNIWEADEKVIPVNEKQWRASGFPIYAFKVRGNRRIAQVIIENLFDIKTHFALISEPLLNASADEIARAWILAKERVGRWPSYIQCDNTKAHVYAYRAYLSERLKIKVLPKIGEASQVHLAEGYHKLMDRKIESGFHGSSAWILHGVWLHFNFVERKDSLNKQTPFEVAIGHKLLANNGWEFLLDLTKRYLRTHSK